MLQCQYLPEYLKALGAENAPKYGVYVRNFTFAKERNIPEDDLFHDLLGKDMRPWTKEESPLTFEYLQVNKKAMEQFTQAADKPMYYSPCISEGGLFESLLPALSQLRQVARTFVCRSNLEITEGDLNTAWADVITIRKIGLHMAAGNGRYPTLIEQLVGIAIDALADGQANNVLASDKLTLVQAKKFLKQWRQFPPAKFDAQTCMMFDRFSGLDFAIRQSQRKLTPDTIISDNDEWIRRLFRIRFNPTAMTRKFNHYYNEMECRGNRVINSYAPLEDKLLEKYLFLPQDVIKGFFLPQPYQNRHFAKFFVVVFLPSLDKSFVLIKAEMTRYDIVKVVCALRIYQLENGRYPEKLDDLPAELLQEYDISLIDSFSGKEYKYSRTDKGFKLYSLGMNYTDEGGKDSKRDGDIIMEIPVPQEKGK